jgi:hypothetical protein
MLLFFGPSRQFSNIFKRALLFAYKYKQYDEDGKEKNYSM